MTTTSPTSEAVTQKKNPGIQFLRALAVTAVVVFHLNPEWLPGGFTGVDVFFVISGYVITHSLVRGWTPRIGTFLASFYVRRIVRILPALFAFLLVTSVLVAMFVPTTRALGREAGETGFFAIFGLSNFSLYLGEREYFDDRIEFNAFSHTWSLGLEEQFYLLFPLLLWGFISLRSRSGSGWVRFLSWAIVLVPVVLSLAYARWQVSEDPTGAFYLLPGRFWELGFGALLALAIIYLGEKGWWRSARAGVLAGILGFALIGWATISADSELFPYPWALAPVAGTALMIIAFERRDTQPGLLDRIISLQPIQRLGDWSYSIYLWHWGVIVLMRWTVGIDQWWHYLVAIVTTLVLGSLSYRFIEQPFLSWRRKASPSTVKVSIATVTIVAVMAGSIHTTFRLTGELSLSSQSSQAAFDPPDDYPDPRETFHHLAGTAEGRTVYAIGNSHAGHLMPLLNTLGSHMGFDPQFVQDGACPLARFNQPRGECGAFQDVIDEVIESTLPGDIVIFSSLVIPRISASTSGQVSSVEEIVEQYLRVSDADRQQLSLEQSRDVILQLREAGLFVIVTRPTPVFPSPPFRCLDWFNEMNVVCEGGFEISRRDIERLSVPPNAIIDQLEAEGLVQVWDLFEELCPGETCRTERDGRHLYTDADHLSKWGNYALIPSFVEELALLWDLPKPELPS